MPTLTLQLAGPMQSWGSASRFNRRATDDVPTKSGIVGLLAAAAGRRRSDPIEDLTAIRLGVRIDVPGALLRDYHTAWVDAQRKTQLSDRYYLTDAVFLAVIEGSEGLIDGMALALASPVFPLSLGRRCCVPSRQILKMVSEDDLPTVMLNAEWLAPSAIRRRAGSSVGLETVVDCAPGTPGSQVRRDEPISFDPERRDYGWRSVLRSRIEIPTGNSPAVGSDPITSPIAVADHDPLELL